MNPNGTDPLPAPKPAPAASGGKNGESKLPAGALDANQFAAYLTEMDREPVDATKSPATAKPNEAPEESADATEPKEPGEEISEEQKPEAEGDEPKAEEADETDLSQTEEQELNEALKGLNADAKSHLMEIAEAIAKGETTIGQVKRQLKLGRQENEEMTQLREKVKQLEAAPPTLTTSAGIPPTVAKLKTLDEVTARTEAVETSIEAIEDFLDKNPQGGVIGDTEFTREQLIDRKRAFRDELKALPKQAATLQQAAQVQELQSKNQAQARKDYPWLADAEHPETKAVREKLKAFPFLHNTANPEYWAAVVVRGEKAMVDERTRRTAGAAGQRPNVQKPAGAVPKGKPHTAAGATARATPTAAPASDLIKAVKDKNSFAELLANTNR